MKIMIVEDHSGMRQMMRNLFVASDTEVWECADGADALPAYQQFRPDWVLMDVVMKGLDGLTATRQIKAAFPTARILMVADQGDTHLRRAARAAGACGFVLKDNLLEVNAIMKTPQTCNTGANKTRPKPKIGLRKSKPAKKPSPSK